MVTDNGIEIKILGEEQREKKFSEVRKYNDLCDIVFGLKDQGVTLGVGLSGRPETKEEGRYFSKVEFLEKMASGFNNADIWYVFDNEGKGHNLEELTKRMDLGEMSEEETRQTMERSWLTSSIFKATEMAGQVGGKVMVLEDPEMESGVAAVVLYPRAESLKVGQERFYRAVNDVDLEGIAGQVCGMLRVGENEQRQPMRSPMARSEVIVDDNLGQLVESLAIDPSEEGYLRIIEYYKEHGLKVAEENSSSTGLNSLRRMVKDGYSFGQALPLVHRGLMRGVVGISPYVSTSGEIGGVEDFLGSEGGVIVMNVNSKRVCGRSTIGEKEVLIAGMIKPDELVAFVPINYVGDVREFDREKMNEAMNKAVADIDVYLAIEVIQ